MSGATGAAGLLILFLLACAGAGPCFATQGVRPHPPHGHWRPHAPVGPRVLPPNQNIEFNQGYSETLVSSPPPVFLPPGPGPRAPERSVAPAPRAPSLSQGMAITVRKILRDDADNGGVKPSPLIERPKEAAEHLADCWSPPVPPKGETVEVTIRFAFDGQGGVIGAPRVTYVKPFAGASAEAVRGSILTAVRDCTPMRFTESMAASAGGYPLAIRFIGQRLERQE